MIRIMLADDHQIIRKGLRGLLGAEPDFSIVGEAGDGLETVILAEQLQPDVLVLDLMMPGLNGLEVIRQLKHNGVRIATAILSMHSDEAYVREALLSGARAYIVKESPPEELIRAIREVAAGRCYLSPQLPQPSISSYACQTEVGSSFSDLKAHGEKPQKLRSNSLKPVKK